MPQDKRAVEAVGKLKYLQTKRSNFDSMWQDIGDRILPRKADFTTKRFEGETRTTKNFDSVAERALDRFASGAHNAITPMGQVWFYLEPEDKSLMLRPRARAYFQEVERLMMNVFNSSASRFHPAMAEFYVDWGAFGNGCVFEGEDTRTGPYFVSFPLNTCYIQVNAKGDVNTLYRTPEFSAVQLKDMFGADRLPESVKRALSDEPYKMFKCVHAVEPNLIVDGWNLPFRSMYILVDELEVLGEPKGYEEFPYLFGRFTQNGGELYGRGPGNRALPDVKMLNAMLRTFLSGAQMAVWPPVITDDESLIKRKRIEPGEFLYGRMRPNGRFGVQPFESGARVDLGNQLVQEYRDEVEKHFYLDLLQLPDPVTSQGSVQHMSATEVSERMREQLKFLGSVFARMVPDMLYPLVNRTYNIMARSRMLPEPPPELQGISITPRFKSPLAVAMESQDVATIQQMYNMVRPFAEINPDVLLKFDENAAINIIADRLHVPAEVIRSDEQYQAALAQRRQDQQNAVASDDALKQAQALNQAAQASKNFQG